MKSNYQALLLLTLILTSFAHNAFGENRGKSINQILLEVDEQNQQAHAQLREIEPPFDDEIEPPFDDEEPPFDDEIEPPFDDVESHRGLNGGIGGVIGNAVSNVTKPLSNINLPQIDPSKIPSVSLTPFACCSSETVSTLDGGGATIWTRKLSGKARNIAEARLACTIYHLFWQRSTCPENTITSPPPPPPPTPVQQMPAIQIPPQPQVQPVPVQSTNQTSGYLPVIATVDARQGWAFVPAHNGRVKLDFIEGAWTVDRNVPLVYPLEGHRQAVYELFSDFKPDRRFRYGQMLFSDGERSFLVEYNWTFEITRNGFWLRINDYDGTLSDNHGVVRVGFRYE